MRIHLCGALAATTLLLLGCSSDPAPTPAPATDAEAGCTVRIDWEGTTYRADNEVDAAAATSTTALGTGRPVDCDGAPVADYGDVEVSAIDGVEPEVAVAVTGGVDGDLSGIYVAEGVTELPEQLSAP